MEGEYVMQLTKNDDSTALTLKYASLSSSSFSYFCSMTPNFFSIDTVLRLACLVCRLDTTNAALKAIHLLLSFAACFSALSFALMAISFSLFSLSFSLLSRAASCSNWCLVGFLLAARDGTVFTVLSVIGGLATSEESAAAFTVFCSLPVPTWRENLFFLLPLNPPFFNGTAADALEVSAVTAND